MANTDTTNSFIYVFIIIGLSLGMFVLFVSIRSIIKFINKQYDDFIPVKPSSPTSSNIFGSIFSAFSTLMTSLYDWFLYTIDEWETSDNFISSLKWDSKTHPWEVITLYSIINSVIFILNVMLSKSIFGGPTHVTLSLITKFNNYSINNTLSTVTNIRCFCWDYP